MDFKEAVCELYLPGVKFSFEEALSIIQITNMDGVYEDSNVKVTKTGDKYNITWKYRKIEMMKKDLSDIDSSIRYREQFIDKCDSGSMSINAEALNGLKFELNNLKHKAERIRSTLERIGN